MTAALRIGWYVHHHGAGHRTRARLVSAELGRRGHLVTLLGSGPGVDVTLPRDDDGVDIEGSEVTAGGRLHWVPLRHEGLRARQAAIAGWLQESGADVLVADVSVEVTVLARVLGVPVVVVAQPGVRDDPPHELAYDLASAVLAPWPAGLAAQVAPHLRAVATKVHEVGGLSSLAGREASPPRPGTGVVLSGSEGFDAPSLTERVLAATPDRTWQVLDGSSWVEDVGAVLAGAEVVLAHTGQNAVADVAALDRPLLALPQDRPFDEQEHLAGVLGSERLARVVTRERQSDPATDWAAEVATAIAAPTSWTRWETAGAVGRAADVVEGVAR